MPPETRNSSVDKLVMNAIDELQLSGLQGNSSGAYVLKTLQRGLRNGDLKPYINDAMQELQASGIGITGSGLRVLKLLRQAWESSSEISGNTSATLMPESLNKAINESSSIDEWENYSRIQRQLHEVLDRINRLDPSGWSAAHVEDVADSVRQVTKSWDDFQNKVTQLRNRWAVR
jgi:hypothetical protein